MGMFIARRFLSERFRVLSACDFGTAGRGRGAGIWVRCRPIGIAGSSGMSAGWTNPMPSGFKRVAHYGRLTRPEASRDATSPGAVSRPSRTPANRSITRLLGAMFRVESATVTDPRSQKSGILRP